MASPGDENKQPVDWKFCTPPPEGVADCQSVILGGKLFISGQFTSSTSSEMAKLFILVLKGDNGWSVLPAPASHCGVTTYKEELVLVGGKEVGSGLHTNKLWNSRDAGETWLEEMPAMPTDRNSAAAINIGKPECILVAGGEKGGLLKTVEVLVTGTWWTLEPMPLKSSRLKAAVFEGTLYLLGGYRQKISMFFSKVSTIMAACSAEQDGEEKLMERQSSGGEDQNCGLEGVTLDQLDLHAVDRNKLQNLSGADTQNSVSQGTDGSVTTATVEPSPVWSKSFAPLRNSCCACDGRHMVTCGKAYFSYEPPKIYSFNVQTMSWSHLWFLPDELNAISLATFLPSGELMAMDSSQKIVRGFLPVETDSSAKACGTPKDA